LSVVPAALFLVDFGSNEPAAAIADEPLRGPAAAGDDGATERLEEFFARGIEEGRAAAEAQGEVRLEEQKAAFEQGLAVARETWCSEEGARIAGQITAAVRDLEERIAHSAERALRPFVAQAVRDRAVVELRASLQELIAASPGVTLEISGPEDLLEAVRTSLSASVATVSYVASDACDVQVKAGASILETRIETWLKQIEGALS
jgi:hypothetical protein